MIEKIQGKLLNTAQTLINKAYEKEGLTDRVLEAQIRLNKQRHVFDIHDKNEEVDEEGFVQ